MTRRSLAGLVPLLGSGSLMALMYTAVSSVLAQMAQDLRPDGDGALLAQVFMAMPSIGMMAGGIASAVVAARLGARRLLLGGLLLYAVAGGSGWFAPPVALLMAGRFVLGLAAAAVATACVTLLAALYEPAQRQRYVGYQSSLGAAFGLVSTLLAGAAAARWGWHAPFTFYALAVPLAVLAWAGLPASAGAPLGAAPGGTSAAALPWRRVAPLYALCLPLYAAVFMTMAQVPFLLREDGVANPADQAWVLSMSSLWNAVGAAAYGGLRQRWGGPVTFAVALALLACGHLTLGLSHGALFTALGCSLSGAGAGLVVPHVPNLLIERVDGAARGRALGLMYTALYLGSFANPLLVAPLAAWLGRHGALLVSAALLAGGAALVLARRAQAPRQALR
jgi:MFS family permease